MEDCELCNHSNKQDAKNESDNGAEDDDNSTDDDKDINDDNYEKAGDMNPDKVLQDKDSSHVHGGNRKGRTISHQQQHGHTASVHRHGLRRVSLRGITKNRGKRWRIRGKERDWLTTAPYDERVPFSHRYGYTYAKCTSNDHMRRWQSSRGILSGQSL